MILLSINFICIYGAHYECWYSEEIQLASVFFGSPTHTQYLSIIVYLVLMYFMIDVNTSKSLLFAPIMFLNFGYVVIAIVLLTDLIKIPFHHFFQALSAQAFVSAACGSAITSAILHHLFNHLTTKNYQQISANIDHVNANLHTITPSQLQHMINNQLLLVSFKKVYGYLVMMSLLCFIGFLFCHNPYLSKWSKVNNKLLKSIVHDQELENE